jgi:hypothetical protein
MRSTLAPSFDQKLPVGADVKLPALMIVPTAFGNVNRELAVVRNQLSH